MARLLDYRRRAATAAAAATGSPAVAADTSGDDGGWAALEAKAALRLAAVLGRRAEEVLVQFNKG
jgi:hypothetical protein